MFNGHILQESIERDFLPTLWNCRKRELRFCIAKPKQLENAKTGNLGQKQFNSTKDKTNSCGVSKKLFDGEFHTAGNWSKDCMKITSYGLRSYPFFQTTVSEYHFYDYQIMASNRSVGTFYRPMPPGRLNLYTAGNWSKDCMKITSYGLRSYPFFQTTVSEHHFYDYQIMASNRSVGTFYRPMPHGKLNNHSCNNIRMNMYF
eukprot:gene6748-13674_t